MRGRLRVDWPNTPPKLQRPVSRALMDEGVECSGRASFTPASHQKLPQGKLRSRSVDPASTAERELTEQAGRCDGRLLRVAENRLAVLRRLLFLFWSAYESSRAPGLGQTIQNGRTSTFAAPF